MLVTAAAVSEPVAAASARADRAAASTKLSACSECVPSSHVREASAASPKWRAEASDRPAARWTETVPNGMAAWREQRDSDRQN